MSRIRSKRCIRMFTFTVMAVLLLLTDKTSVSAASKKVKVYVLEKIYMKNTGEDKIFDKTPLNSYKYYTSGKSAGLLKSSSEYSYLGGSSGIIKYDSKNRIKQINTDFAGYKFTYDKKGRVSKATSGDGGYYINIKFKYDKKNRVSQETVKKKMYLQKKSKEAVVTYTNAYKYNSAGNISQIKSGMPENKYTISLTYDKKNNPNKIVWKDSKGKVYKKLSYKYTYSGSRIKKLGNYTFTYKAITVNKSLKPIIDAQQKALSYGGVLYNKIDDEVKYFTIITNAQGKVS